MKGQWDKMVAQVEEMTAAKKEMEEHIAAQNARIEEYERMELRFAECRSEKADLENRCDELEEEAARLRALKLTRRSIQGLSCRVSGRDLGWRSWAGIPRNSRAALRKSGASC